MGIVQKLKKTLDEYCLKYSNQQSPTFAVSKDIWIRLCNELHVNTSNVVVKLTNAGGHCFVIEEKKFVRDIVEVFQPNTVSPCLSYEIDLSELTPVWSAKASVGIPTTTYPDDPPCPQCSRRLYLLPEKAIYRCWCCEAAFPQDQFKQ